MGSGRILELEWWYILAKTKVAGLNADANEIEELTPQPHKPIELNLELPKWPLKIP